MRRFKSKPDLKDSRTIEPLSPKLATPEQRVSMKQEIDKSTAQGPSGSNGIFPPITHSRRSNLQGTKLKF